jgi:hypothetical protein
MPAPAYQLTGGPNGLIATSATMDNPGDSKFDVWRVDAGTWTPAVPSPFGNRMEPGIGVVGNRVVVLGGLEGPSLQPRQDAWVLNFAS